MILELAGFFISIVFLDKTREVLSFYEYVYQKFLISSAQIDAKMTVHTIEDSFESLLDDIDPSPEILVPTPRVTKWLNAGFKFRKEPNITPQTIAVRLLNGLLLYTPDCKEGNIYLSAEPTSNPYRPLFHLLWIFFAQVLGEFGACFVHAAGLGKDDNGYLFMGPPGGGKSTISSLCSGCKILSDDSPILKASNGSVRIFPSPIHQLPAEQAPGNVIAPFGIPLRGIYFIIRDNVACLRSISRSEALGAILSHGIHYFSCLSPSARAKLFDIFLKLCHTISTSYLHFQLNTRIFSLITRQG